MPLVMMPCFSLTGHQALALCHCGQSQQANDQCEGQQLKVTTFEGVRLTAEMVKRYEVLGNPKKRTKSEESPLLLIVDICSLFSSLPWLYLAGEHA